MIIIGIVIGILLTVLVYTLLESEPSENYLKQWNESHKGHQDSLKKWEYSINQWGEVLYTSYLLL